MLMPKETTLIHYSPFTIAPEQFFFFSYNLNEQ